MVLDFSVFVEEGRKEKMWEEEALMAVCWPVFFSFGICDFEKGVGHVVVCAAKDEEEASFDEVAARAAEVKEVIDGLLKFKERIIDDTTAMAKKVKAPQKKLKVGPVSIFFGSSSRIPPFLSYDQCTLLLWIHLMRGRRENDGVEWSNEA